MSSDEYLALSGKVFLQTWW